MRQRGVALLLFTASLVVVLGMLGLALDLGLAYLARTRLQNALDAAALSGAKTLNYELSTTLATTAAQAAFDLNKGSLTVTPTIEFSPTLSPFNAGGANPKFVRVKAGPVSVLSRLVRIIPEVGDAINVAGTAVAGPMYLGEEQCGAIPVVLCGSAGDTDCSDGSCYGLGAGPGVESTFTGKDTALGPGNFGFIVLDCGTGANCLRKGLAGSSKICFNAGETTPTEPGLSAGSSAQGLNTRFGIYNGPVSPAEYPPDKVTDHSPLMYYSEYRSRLQNGPYNYPNGVAQRRAVLVPVGDCSGGVSGRTDVPILGGACVFLTRPMSGTGKGAIYGEFVGSCPAIGTPPETPATSGPFIIVMYQDPDGG